MVNYGRSRACLTCKNRRIKCDETRPSCKRCLRIGKICPGYPTEWDLAFRSENKVIASKVPSTPPTWALAITGLSSDLELWVIKVFYRDYVLEPCGGCVGWLSFLPAMYEEAIDGSILRLSMCSAAYANFAQKTERKDLKIVALSGYDRALSLASAVIAKCAEVPRETIMTAVFLLGLYENITSKYVESPRQHHSKGLGALADLRGELLLKGNGPGLLEIVCCQRQRHNLDLEVGPSPADIRLIKLLDSSSVSSHTIINCYEVSKFIERTNACLLQGIPSPNWFSTLHTQVEELDKRFQTWDRDATIILKFSNMRTKADAKIFSFDERAPFDTYPAWITTHWNRHRAARMILHQTFLRALAACENERFPAYDTQQLSSQEMIQKLAVEILHSVPSALNYGSTWCNPPAPRSLAGYIFIWPLQVVMRCPHLADTQRMEAINILERIGLDCGLSYAVVYARSFMSDAGTITSSRFH